MLWVLAALGVVSFVCLLHLWFGRRRDGVLRRLVWSVLVMIPLVGPLLYGALYEPPAVGSTPREVQQALDGAASIAGVANHPHA
jgi:bacteriorhodopsin